MSVVAFTAALDVAEEKASNCHRQNGKSGELETADGGVSEEGGPPNAAGTTYLCKAAAPLGKRERPKKAIA